MDTLYVKAGTKQSGRYKGADGETTVELALMYPTHSDEGRSSLKVCTLATDDTVAVVLGHTVPRDDPKGQGLKKIRLENCPAKTCLRLWTKNPAYFLEAAPSVERAKRGTFFLLQ